MSAQLIFLAFLKSGKSDDPEFQSGLESLEQSLGRDGDLETDSHSPVSFCTLETDGGPQSVVDEDLCRRIGAQLAQMGDRFEQEGRIKQEVVESLVHDILNESLTEERFADAVKNSLDRLPPGMELEQAAAVVAMTLTKKVGCSVPTLLQNCFTTALNFMQRNCGSCIALLARQGGH